MMHPVQSCTTSILNTLYSDRRKNENMDLTIVNNAYFSKIQNLSKSNGFASCRIQTRYGNMEISTRDTHAL